MEVLGQEAILYELVYETATRMHTISANLLAAVCWLRKDNLTAELSDAWQVDLEKHIIRKVGYKGRQINVTDMDIQLPWDAFTLPGVFFAVAGLNLTSESCFALSRYDHARRLISELL